jgi:gamma-glutamylcyclotransferase (GGCT)/AIG2-like uncharacterized protein YtfP
VTAEQNGGEGREDGGEWVFVYGTLRRGASESARMGDAKWIGKRLATGRLLCAGNHPALVRSPDPISVVDGDLYRVSNHLLAELDGYHGLNSGRLEGANYARVRRVVSEHGYHAKSSGAWTWVWMGPTAGAEEVKSGDWLDVEQPRTKPFYTWIAFACALGLPGFGPVVWWLGQSLRSTAGDIALGALSVMALLSPVAGCFAYYFAESRREGWIRFRTLVLVVLLMECPPALIMSVALLPGLVSWFR